MYTTKCKCIEAGEQQRVLSIWRVEMPQDMNNKSRKLNGMTGSDSEF